MIFRLASAGRKGGSSLEGNHPCSKEQFITLLSSVLELIPLNGRSFCLVFFTVLWTYLFAACNVLLIYFYISYIIIFPCRRRLTRLIWTWARLNNFWNYWKYSSKYILLTILLENRTNTNFFTLTLVGEIKLNRKSNRTALTFDDNNSELRQILFVYLFVCMYNMCIKCNR